MPIIINLDVVMARRKIGAGELAEKVGVRRETIIRLEKGQYNPSLNLAMDIAKVFGAAVEDIFSFGPDPAEDYQVFENKYEN